jgi:hypothetical protein
MLHRVTDLHGFFLTTCATEMDIRSGTWKVSSVCRGSSQDFEIVALERSERTRVAVGQQTIKHVSIEV